MDFALRQKLLADTALAGLVTKIAWDERPETGSFADGRGVIVLTMVAPGRDYTHAGWDGLDEALVQADVWARDPDVARSVTLALTAAIEPETTVAEWVIGPAFLQAEDSGQEDLGGSPIFRRRQDWIVMARPAP